MQLPENGGLVQGGVMIENITKSDNDRPILHSTGVRHFEQGQLSVITGPSGSGKTTLLNIITGLDMPDSGRVWANYSEVTALRNDRERTAFRGENGYIFQSPGLSGGMTVEQNIYLLHDIQGHEVKKEWVDYLLGRLGVDGLIHQYPSKISGGQAQRVSIVRALAHQPQLIFADEPSAALESKAKQDVYTLLREITHKFGATAIAVSHDEVALRRGVSDKIIEMRDGEIIRDFQQPR